MDFNTDLILNAAGIGIIAADKEYYINFINTYAAEMLELEEKDSIGSHLSDILPSAASQLKKCMESGECQLGYKLKNDTYNIVGSISPIHVGIDIAGIVCCLFGSKEIELMVKEHELYNSLIKEMGAVFNYSSFGSWVSDADGTVLKLNKTAEEHIGIKAKDIVGKKAWYLLEKGFVDRSATGQVVDSKQRTSFIQHAIKTNKDLLVQATPVFDEEGKLFKIISNTRDVTALNAIRKELERSKSVAEKYKEEIAKLSMLELKDNRFVAESPKMKQILFAALKLSKMEASEILILGASGVGKGLLSKLIHKYSQRANEPFIQINCAALPESLLEAELFGYEKGAFTGAGNNGKIGLIELAQNGTLFLDEIGDMPLAVQAKLLTYLDNYIVRPLGSIQEKTIKCTVIAATNKNLQALIQQRLFREDLLFRLNTFSVKIPPLRERPEDIFAFVNLFLKKYNDLYGQRRRISGRLLRTLRAYAFPGNVRELKSLIKQAVVMSDSDVLDDFILSNLGDECLGPDGQSTSQCGLNERLRSYEKELLKDALVHNSTTREMAGYLSISQSTVVKKLKKYGLPGPMITNRIT